MPPKELTGYRILVVDDEEDLREILSEDFALLGATVFTAPNGNVAYDIALRESPHVIISDVRMPGGDGVDLLKRIRLVQRGTPPHIFLLTGFADLQAEQAKALGSQGLMPKPFNLKLLREQVISVLRDTSV